MAVPCLSDNRPTWQTQLNFRDMGKPKTIRRRLLLAFTGIMYAATIARGAMLESLLECAHMVPVAYHYTRGQSN